MGRSQPDLDRRPQRRLKVRPGLQAGSLLEGCPQNTLPPAVTSDPYAVIRDEPTLFGGVIIAEISGPVQHSAH
jgi:hypothetical protein